MSLNAESNSPAGASPQDAAAALWEATSEAVLQCAAGGVVIEANPAAEQLAKQPGTSFLKGRGLRDCGLFEEEHAVALMKALDAALATGTPGPGTVTLSISIPGPDSKPIPAGVSITKTGYQDAQGSPTALVRISSLATQRALEEQVRVLQRMEAMGKLAAGLAHDFNNVLTVIKGYAEIILMAPSLKPELSKQIRSIATSAERGASVTRQLLTFGRRHIVELSQLDINEAISNTANMLRRLVRENVTLEFRYSSPLPAIHADLGMVEQLVCNLVLQARDALPFGGRVLVETFAAARPESLANGPDSGVLLQLQAIALPNTQTSTAELDGTPALVESPLRLGIEVVRSIVAQTGGIFEIQGGGDVELRLKAWLPGSTVASHAATDKAAQHAAAPEPAMPTGTETILLVEDEPSVRELARSILTGLGYHVIEAGSGPEALTVWQDHAAKVDILFTDMVMPGGIAGRVLAQLLQATKPGLKVLYTTGYSLDLVQSNLPLKRGVNLLPKPYNASSLARAIRNRLDGSVSV